MSAFVDFIDNMHMVDLLMSGGRFTWSNFLASPSCSRLDRFLSFSKLLVNWPNLAQSLRAKSVSDHNVVALSFVDFNWGPRTFKWFDFWADEKDFKKVIPTACSKMDGKGIGSILSRCHAEPEL
ncbi:hypothetical protein V6N13_037438 [Hibiscus sabdariffa]